MSLLDFILHPFTERKFREWDKQLKEKMKQAERDVNHWMMGDRKIIYTQEEVRKRIRESAKALRKVGSASSRKRLKRFRIL